jgi:hypothetical protein
MKSEFRTKRSFEFRHSDLSNHLELLLDGSVSPLSSFGVIGRLCVLCFLQNLRPLFQLGVRVE